jgi:hypothetical protein
VLGAQCDLMCAEGRCWKRSTQCWLNDRTTAFGIYAKTGGGSLTESNVFLFRRTASSCMKECANTDSRAHTIPPPPDSDGNTCSGSLGAEESDGFVKFCG